MRTLPARARGWLSAAAGAGALVAAAALMLPPDRRLLQVRFITLSYFLVTALAAFWIWSLVAAWRAARPRPSALWRRWRAGAAAAAVLTAIVGASVEPRMRVLSDEADLLATAQNLFFERRADVASQGTWVNGRFELRKNIAVPVPKRPLLFPYAVQALHLLTGYRAANAFTLNLLCLFALLLFLYGFLEPRWGGAWACAAMVLAAAQPIVSLNARSAGMDLFSLCFTAGAFAAALGYLRAPSPASLALLWTTALMTAHTRHESLLVGGVLAAGLGATGCVRREDLAANAGRLAFTPLLLAPLFWQRLIVTNPFENGRTPPFAEANALRHNAEFVGSLFRWDGVTPYAGFVNAAGLAALVFFGWRAARGRLATDDAPLRRFLLFLAAWTALQWIFITSFFRGSPLHPAHARYFAVFAVILSVAAAAGLRQWRALDGRRALLLAAAAFTLYHGTAVQDRLGLTLVTPRQTAQVLRYLESRPGQSLVIISDHPAYWAPHGYGALSFDTANGRRQRFLAEAANRAYDDVLVVQEIALPAGKPIRRHRLHADYRLETLFVVRRGPRALGRVSRVVP
jgi:hypothetical protein